MTAVFALQLALPLLFIAWTGPGLHVARDAVIKTVLATPPDQVASASRQEQARVNAMLDHILPVSARAAGPRSDSVLGRSLERCALQKIRAPTLIISARDDGYGTYASARYTTSQIARARFIGFEHGGHTFVGHDDEVRAEILKLLIPGDTP
jgi:2-hydroxy-6-oxonona-2,4-dienedioate hydrolase